MPTHAIIQPSFGPKRGATAAPPSLVLRHFGDATHVAEVIALIVPHHANDRHRIPLTPVPGTCP
jgi:hypothetical protein